ncbi:MAG: LysR family transcriptional regulator [Alcaligenaceae bacterium]|nr:LysR family transcriptional regulator [Alcaligenaceae bacterium]
MRFRQFQQFVAIAEAGSYRRAAETLFIAQPALSVSMQKLEHEMGAQLFERGARGVTLTAAGHALLADARRVLFHADQAQRSVRLVAHGESGSLRLGFVGSATYALLPRTIPPFRERYPDIEVSLLEDRSIALLGKLKNNAIDAALVRGPVAADPDLESWVVERDDFVLAVNHAHPLAGQRHIALGACADYPFVMYSPGEVPGLNSLVLSLCGQAGFAPVVHQEAVQVQTVVSLVASDMGVALVPGVTRAYTNPHVRFVELSDTGARQAVSLLLVTHRNSGCLPIARLRDCMLE